MGETCLRTARSRSLFVTGLTVTLVTMLLVTMIVTAFAADGWWPEPEDGISAAYLWVSLSQLVTFLVLVFAAIFAFVFGLTVLVEFFFNSKVRRPGSSFEPAPFRTLRDRSKKYDAAIVALRRAMTRAGRVIRSPFTHVRRAVENWIDRGE